MNRNTNTPSPEIARMNSEEMAVSLLPTNSLVTPMLTDMYQISMTYAYWKQNRHNHYAVFDLFFRKCPFNGEFCIFAGLDEVLRLLASFRFKFKIFDAFLFNLNSNRFLNSDIDYLKKIMPTCDSLFFEWLLELDCSQVKVYAMQEGSVSIF